MLKLEPPSTGLLLNISNNWCSPPSLSWQGTGDDQGIIFNRWLFFFSEPLLLWKWSPRAESCQGQAAWTGEKQWHSVRNTSSFFFDNVTLGELLSSFEAKCPKACNEDDITNTCWVIGGSRRLVYQGSQHYVWFTEARTPFFWGSACCGSTYRFMTKKSIKMSWMETMDFLINKVATVNYSF